MAVEMPERGSFKAGPARSRCEGCPSPGGCASCPLRTPNKEVSSDIKFNSFKSLINLNRLPAATIFCNTGGEFLMRLKEKICSICRETASTCGHSKSKTSALAAA